MVSMIEDLCLKAAKHRAAIQQMAAGDKQLNSCAAAGEAPILKRSAAGDSVMAAETAALLTKEIQNMNNKQLQQQDLTLKIELEPTLPSIKNMEDRDRLDTET